MTAALGIARGCAARCLVVLRGDTARDHDCCRSRCRFLVVAVVVVVHSVVPSFVCLQAIAAMVSSIPGRLTSIAPVVDWMGLMASLMPDVEDVVGMASKHLGIPGGAVLRVMRRGSAKVAVDVNSDEELDTEHVSQRDVRASCSVSACPAGQGA